MIRKIGTALHAAFITWLCLAAVPTYAQQHPVSPTPLPRDSLLSIARTIIDSSECQVLVTIDEEGRPRVRAMSPFPPEADWVIWLGTSPDSKKIRQIRAKPEVAVYYYAPDRVSYVSVSGEAEIVDDTGLETTYWKDGWERFFQAPGTAYVLIRVRPSVLEVYSPLYRLFRDSAAEGPVVVEF
jgi:general stress protein 26